MLVSEINIPEPISMNSIPPWRRTKSNIRILKDNIIICSFEVTFSDNGTVMDEVNTDQLFGEGLEIQVNDLFLMPLKSLFYQDCWVSRFFGKEFT